MVDFHVAMTNGETTRVTADEIEWGAGDGCLTMLCASRVVLVAPLAHVAYVKRLDAVPADGASEDNPFAWFKRGLEAALLLAGRGDGEGAVMVMEKAARGESIEVGPQQPVQDSAAELKRVLGIK